MHLVIHWGRAAEYNPYLLLNGSVACPAKNDGQHCCHGEMKIILMKLPEEI